MSNSNSSRTVVLTATTGQEVFEKAIAKVQVFVPNQTGIRAGSTSVPLGGADRLPGRPLQMLQTQPKIDAVRGEPEAHCGAWQTRVVQVAEGTVLQVFAQRRTRWNSVLASANFYLRARSGAAERFVYVPTLQVAGMSALQEAGILGRFDVITPETAAQEHGVATPPMFLGTFKDERFRFLFREDIRAAETAAASLAVVTRVHNAETGHDEETVVVRQATLLEF